MRLVRVSVRRAVGRSFDRLHFLACLEARVHPKDLGSVGAVDGASHLKSTLLASYFVHVIITLIAARITLALNRFCSPPIVMCASYMIVNSSKSIS